MIDRFERRRERLRSALAEQEVATFLVTSLVNVTYLTGFTGDSASLLIAGDRAVLISDGRFTAQIGRECRGLDVHIRPVGQEMMPGVAEVVGRSGAGTVGFEPGSVSVAEFDTLREAAPSIAWRGLRGVVEALRIIKDEDEIAAIRRAIANAEGAYPRVVEALRPEMSEKEATDALELAMRRLGAEGASFPPVVAAGINAALPHYRGGDVCRLGGEDLVLIDWGASLSGYKSDLTRTLPVGKVTPKFAEVYRVVLSAQERAIAAIRPGVSARAVDAEARTAIAEAGFGDFFPHGLGHGIGLEIHESPRLRAQAEDPLRAGMVLTVEPGVYLPDWGGVRIEDDVLVTPDGCEVLTTLPKGLDALPPLF